MSRKPKLPAAPAPRKGLQAARTPDESEGVAVGRALTCPANAAARAMLATEHPEGLGRQIDLPDLADVLRDRAKAVQAGDLSGLEAMLVNQATALQSLHPNHVWLIDASLCVLYYLQAEGKRSGLQVMDADKFYKNKPKALERIER